MSDYFVVQLKAYVIRICYHHVHIWKVVKQSVIAGSTSHTLSIYNSALEKYYKIIQTTIIIIIIAYVQLKCLLILLLLPYTQ